MRSCNDIWLNGFFFVGFAATCSVCLSSTEDSVDASPSSTAGLFLPRGNACAPATARLPPRAAELAGAALPPLPPRVPDADLPPRPPRVVRPRAPLATEDSSDDELSSSPCVESLSFGTADASAASTAPASVCVITSAAPAEPPDPLPAESSSAPPRKRSQHAREHRAARGGVKCGAG